MKKFTIILLIVITGCASTKQNFTESQVTALKNAVESKNIELNFDWANPLATSSLMVINQFLPPGDTAARVNLISNPNYMKLIGDSLSVDLPYYGERQIVVSYGGRDDGISFDGILKDKKVNFNEKKNSYVLNLWFTENQESYRATLNLFPNHTSYLTVYSSHRTTISYTGKWKNLVEEDLASK